jgi:tRNA (guanine-N7-)-methyltransferase
MPRIRVHQHVNPLSPHYIQEPRPVRLEDAFQRPELPLHLDIGSARGRFLLRMAEAEPEWNFLGVEIREPLVTEANRIAGDNGLTNLHYSFCNAMLWLGRLLAEVPERRLQMVTIHFPDPWFKKKHAKRRMVNAELVETVIKHLAPGGRVFIQTDIEFLFEEMAELFSVRKEFQLLESSENPFQVKTEREKAVEEKEMPVFRAIFKKK